MNSSPRRPDAMRLGFAHMLHKRQHRHGNSIRSIALAAAVCLSLPAGAETRAQDGIHLTGSTGVYCQRPNGLIWTCQLPNGTGGYASIKAPSDGTGQPDFAAIAAWMSANMGQDALAFGDTATSAAGAGSIAFGHGATAAHNGSVALGRGSQAGVAVGSASAVVDGRTYGYAGTSPTATVSVGAAGQERTVTNVAAGRVLAGSTDAINGSQLQGAHQAIAAVAGDLDSAGVSVAHALGGSSDYDPATHSVAAGLSVSGATYTTVQDALSAVQTRYYSVNSSEAGLGSNRDNKGATGTDALAAGVHAGASSAHGVAVGSRALSQAVAGVAVGHRAVTQAENGLALGTQAVSQSLNGIALGTESVAQADDGVAIGTNTVSQGSAGVAVGFKAGVQGQSNVAVGHGAGVQGASGLAAGHAAVVQGDEGIALGRSAVTFADSAISVGAGASSSGDKGVAIGTSARVTLADNVALGSGSVDRASVQVSSATVVGGGLTLNYGGFAGAAIGVVSVGAAGAQRQIANVAPGEISASSTDAINGSQLYAVASKLQESIHGVVGGQGVQGPAGPAGPQGPAGPAGPQGNDGAVGPAGPQGPAGADGSGGNGGSSGAQGPKGDKGDTGGQGLQGVPGLNGKDGKDGLNGKDGGEGAVKYTQNTDGTYNQNEVKLNPGGVGATTITNVADGKNPGDAVNVNQLHQVTNKWVAGNPVNYVAPQATGQDSTAVGSGSVASGRNSVALGNNSNDGGRDDVVSVGLAGHERQVINVAPGTQGTDAVNVDQLRALGVAGAAYTDARVNQLQSAMNLIGKRAYAGVAASMAMESAPFVSGKTTYAAALGHYEGQSALGVTLRRTADNGRWSLTGGLSATTAGNVGVRVGIAGVLN